MKKSAAIFALVSFLAVPVGVSFAGTTTTSTSSARSSPPSPAPAARTTTSFGSSNSAPKQAAAPAPAPTPKPTPAAAPAPAQKSLAFGTTGNAPAGKATDPAPSKSVSAMSADLTKSAQQKSAIDSWDNRNRVATTAPTDVSRDHVLPDSGKRWDSPATSVPSQGDRSLASAREQSYRERQARQDQIRAEELRIERLREEQRLEMARQRASSDNNLVNGVIIGSMMNHDRHTTVVVQQPTAPYQPAPAAPSADDRQLQRYEAPQSSRDESSGSGFFWFFVIVLAASAFAGVYWFLNRKPAFAGSVIEPARHEANYDLK